MSYGLETLPPSKSSPSTDKGWTEEELAAFDAIVERLKHLRNGQTADPSCGLRRCKGPLPDDFCGS
jgi:hypothetical protein